MKNIELCLSPEMLHLFDLKDKTVVVVDILRATSCMTTAFANGIQSIIPVKEIEECKALQSQGYLAAAERAGEKVDGFELDNSPFSYMNPELKGKTIAMTTTNGTKAITESANASEVIIGSFLNISTVADYLLQKQQDVLILCSGWKGEVSMEDTLFGGALLEKSDTHFIFANDAARLASSAYKVAKKDIKEYMGNCSHFQRLTKLGRLKDIDFCFTEDLYTVIPVLSGKELVKK